MNDKVRIGVVGCGYWGPNLARNFNSLPDCELVVLCDNNLNRLNRLGGFYPNVKLEASYEKMLLEYRLDAVIVATPIDTHYELAKKALLAKCHVFVEKPMTNDLSQCLELGEIAEKSQLILMSGFVFLHAPPVLEIKKMIDSGQLGKILYINSRRLSLGIFQKNINVVWDLAPHDLSMIRFFLGREPKLINCVGQSHITPGVVDVAWIGLDFGSTYATVQTSWLDPCKVREMTIVGSEKMVVYNDVHPSEKVRIYDSKVKAPSHYNTFAEFQFSYHYGNQYIPRIPLEEPLQTEARHFINCILSGSYPFTGLDTSLSVIRILESAERSLSKGGGPVELEEVTLPKSADTDSIKNKLMEAIAIIR